MTARRDAAAAAEADERVLGWGLAEALGGERPPDLAAAVAARAAGASRGDAARVAAATTRRGWFAAVLLAAGVAVAAGVALLRALDGDRSGAGSGGVRAATGAREPAPQDPPAAHPPVEGPANGVTTRETFAYSALESGSSRVSIGEDTLRDAARSPGLRELQLDGYRELQGEWLRHLGGLAKLERVSLAFAQVGEAGVDHLGKLPSLRHLDLSFDQTLDGEALAKLVGAQPGLRTLSVRGCGRLDAQSLRALAKLRELERLDLGMLCGVDLGPKLARTPRPVLLRTSVRLLLTELRASGAALPVVDADVVAAVAALPKLAALDLSFAAELPAAAVEALGRSASLRELVLDDARATDVVLAALPVALTKLSLARATITDDGLKATAERLVGWTDADLTGCKALTDGGLAVLLDRRELRTLSIRGCAGLTAACVDALLAETTLVELDVSGLKFVDDAVATRLRDKPGLVKLTNQRSSMAVFTPK